MIAKLRAVALDVAGLASFVTAAFYVAPALGYMTAGVACFVLQWRVNE